MKPLLFSLLTGVLSLLFVVSPAHAQSCSGDITLTTQAAANAFACTTVTGSLTIESGPDDPITDLSPLDGLSYVGGNLAISNNAALTSLEGLGDLTYVGGDLSVLANESLTSLAGLERVSSTGARLTIAGNVALTSLADLEALSYVGAEFTISDNDALASLEGLEGLTGVGADFVIERNAALASLEGLSGLSALQAGLRLDDNDGLTSLAGLTDLSSVSGSLSITRNDALTSLADLRGLSYVGEDLDVTDNPALSACSCGLSDLTSGGAFTNVIGTVTIAGNASGCASTAEVLSGSCETETAAEDAGPEGTPDAYALLQNYPNPFNPQTVIDYDVAAAVHVRLAVFDVLGREVQVLVDERRAPGRHTATFDASALPSGLYVYRIEMGPYRASGRMVVLK